MAGAIASRVEELQNTTAPITFVLMGGYLAAIITAGDPGGPVARVTSYLPFSAPMVMPIRMAAGEASVVELVASVAVVLASVARRRAHRRPGLLGRRPAAATPGQAPRGPVGRE